MTVQRPDDRVLSQAIRRIGTGNYAAWTTQLANAANCHHPVRLRGRLTATDVATGETETVFSTAGQPNGVLLKACRSRRATRCPACAITYQGDARALILAGLLGGKGIAVEIAEHPVWFLTLTAPSFGAVHTADSDRPSACHPQTTGTCAHGPLRCTRIHDEQDPLLGQSLCEACYDYAGTVIWNNRAGELWRRTIITLRRQLGRRTGSTPKADLAYVKVAEYQARGVVHFHALIRLDADLSFAAQSPLTDDLLEAIMATVSAVHAPNPLRAEDPIRWGPKTVVASIPVDERAMVAGYIAKYATKSVDRGGALDHRLHHGDLGQYPLPDHLRTLAETAWALGAEPILADLNLQAWAHTLGYRGHWLTKSRTWSTTLTRLREDRHLWQRQRAHPEATDRDTIEVGDWEYVGTGHLTDGDSWLAHVAHQEWQLGRRTAWEER